MAGTITYTTILFTLTVLFLFLQQGLSIKCYVCRSDTDAKCADPFDNSTLGSTDCKVLVPPDHLADVGEATMCRKIRQKKGGVWTYFRSCAYLGEPGIEGDERFCLMRTGSFNIFMEYCTCNSKDGCNAGTDIRGSWVVPMSTGILTLGYLLNLA